LDQFKRLLDFLIFKLALDDQRHLTELARMPKPNEIKAPRRAKPPAQAPGVETRTRLMDVAEVLFAERGFHGVSLREVVCAAEVNVAAAHYHFGSKEELFGQVFARCAEPICMLTTQMLNMADEWVGYGEHLEQVLKAHLVPTLRGASGQQRDVLNYNRLRAHIMVQDRAFAGKLMGKIYSELTKRSIRSLQRALPELPPRDLAWRFHLLVQTLIFTTIPAGRVHDTFFHGTYEPDDPAEALDYLVPLLAAMFRAPVRHIRSARSPAPGRIKSTKGAKPPLQPRPR
jgi:AcrR family transcriptional regulator